MTIAPSLDVAEALDGGDGLGVAVEVEAREVGELPALLLLGRQLELARVLGAVARLAQPVRFDRAEGAAAAQRQPIEPSICSSISRFISTEYSIGSSLAIGSMNPLTIIFEASSSSRPWAWR